MWYQYRIAGLSVLCELPFPVCIGRESAEFLRRVENAELTSADLIFRLRSVPQLPEWDGNGYCEGCRVYLEQKGEMRVYHCPAPYEDPFACVIWPRDSCKEIVCYYLEGTEANFQYSRNIFDLLGLETIMRQQHGLLLHASFIRWEQRGILFSAPSGMGKSTQADLWVRRFGASLLNGDRAAVRRGALGWTAYGLPYAGSSQVFRNESAPVSAIVALRQEKENHIRSLHPAEAVRYLFPECTIHHWDRTFVSDALELLLAFICEVPVYLLECLPDYGAVTLLRDEILKTEGGAIHVSCPGGTANHRLFAQ